MAESENTPTPTRGSSVTLDKLRRFRYSFRTRREMIEKLGGEEQLTAGLEGETLCLVVWYGLKHEDPDLTVEQVEDLVDMENLTAVVTAMSVALGYKGKPLVGVLAEQVADPTTAAAASAESP